MDRDIPNFVDGRMRMAAGDRTFGKLSPHTGREIFRVARSGREDAAEAVAAAQAAQPSWAALTPVARGDRMRDIALRMTERREEIAGIVAAEGGKALSHAMGETQAAIEMGMFIAGEGRRSYGRTMPATMAHRQVLTVRQPLGVAALVIASNTPIANVAWKAFPSMFCGNASVMKPSEDTPATAWIFADICREVGVPPGVFNVVQGYGAEAGAPLVEDPRVDLVSFTGGSETGRRIQQAAGARLAKVCMELGGKNPLVVCDDADLDRACAWVLQSSFSNAGQRCASSSRIIVFDAIYDRFREMLSGETKKLKAGTGDLDFLGPVINGRQLAQMVDAVERAREMGAAVVAGGARMTGEAHRDGFYMAPTILEGCDPSWPISRSELFGPVTCLYRARDFAHALELANDCDFGLTACVHTASLHRAMRFAEGVRAGVVVVNGGTHGSEPHMGFGGLKSSGTGWREAGVEALDVYSDWKYVNLISDPGLV